LGSKDKSLILLSKDRQGTSEFLDRIDLAALHSKPAHLSIPLGRPKVGGWQCFKGASNQKFNRCRLDDFILIDGAGIESVSTFPTHRKLQMNWSPVQSSLSAGHDRFPSNNFKFF